MGDLAYAQLPRFVGSQRVARQKRFDEIPIPNLRLETLGSRANSAPPRQGGQDFSINV